MSIVHPAWRFVLALRANEIDPNTEGLPQDGGCRTWNKISKWLSNIIFEDYEGVMTSGDGLSSLSSLSGLNGSSREYQYLVSAYRFFKIKKHRVHAETYLLAGGDEAWLASALQIESGVLSAYKSAFFDTSVFGNGIDKLAYVGNIVDYREREIKNEWTKGADFIKWRMGFDVAVDAKGALSSLLSDVYYQLKQSPDNRESVKRCDVASKIGKELMGSRDAGDFKKKIEEILSLDAKPTKYKTMAELVIEN